VIDSIPSSARSITLNEEECDKCKKTSTERSRSSKVFGGQKQTINSNNNDYKTNQIIASLSLSLFKNTTTTTAV